MYRRKSETFEAYRWDGDFDAANEVLDLDIGPIHYIWFDTLNRCPHCYQKVGGHRGHITIEVRSEGSLRADNYCIGDWLVMCKEATDPIRISNIDFKKNYVKCDCDEEEAG